MRLQGHDDSGEWAGKRARQACRRTGPAFQRAPRCYADRADAAGGCGDGHGRAADAGPGRALADGYRYAAAGNACPVCHFYFYLYLYAAAVEHLYAYRFSHRVRHGDISPGAYTHTRADENTRAYAHKLHREPLALEIHLGGQAGRVVGPHSSSCRCVLYRHHDRQLPHEHHHL